MHESTQNQPNPPHSHETRPSDEWEIVTFPDSMPVDGLQQQVEELPVPPSLVSGDFYLKVQNQNQELRSQVTELEPALHRSQTSLRAEIERWEAVTLAQSDSSESSESLLAQQNQALSGSQVRLGQLFVELENSHRMAQRQQILVETLTDQLQSSHEQIAQLERECAAVQQRSSDNLQQFTQSEQTARDLRSRLHRQQRYTLQFKAALEKCLDVPPATAQGFVADFLDEALNPVVISPPKVKIPRSQPVQPWSVTSAIVEVNESPMLQPWANAIVAESEADSDLGSIEEISAIDETVAVTIETSVETRTETPIVVNPPIEIVSDDDQLDLSQIERNPTLDDAQRLDNWAEVIAQVNAIMGEEVTIVEMTHPGDEKLPTAPMLKDRLEAIAPLISKTKSQKRDAMVAIDLPSFPRHDAK
ncbi:MAG: hypothetical protein LH631_08580 [Alkalinema sp. CAN_BIN05]|nr:hypothetical protein [Alkalinema sp. CAN_BIN05]